MMRENLFKGKRKANGQWIHGDLLHHHNVVGKPLDCYIKPLYDDTECRDWLCVQLSILCKH